MLYQLFIPIVFAVPNPAQPKLIYEQCGGVNYKGSTTCTSDLICEKQNEYYSQCLPSSESGTSSGSSGSQAQAKSVQNAQPPKAPVNSQQASSSKPDAALSTGSQCGQRV